MNGKRATLVIPCLNSAPTLSATLDGIGRLEGRGEIDVLVIDNGSTDGSLAIARRFDGVRVVHCPRRGVGHARNQGLVLASTPAMLSLDADCVPRPDWAALLLAALERADADVLAVGGRTIPRPHPNRWSQRWEVTPHPGRGPGGPLYVVAGNACYRTDAVAWLGGFPPFGADDAALGVIARRGGFGFALEPAAVVEHANPTNARGYIRQMRKIGHYAGQIDPEGVGTWSWWWGRMRHAAGAARAERDARARAVCAAASVAQTIGAIRAVRDPDQPVLADRPPLARSPSTDGRSAHERLAASADPLGE